MHSGKSSKNFGEKSPVGEDFGILSLTDELLLKILGYLTIIDLCRTAIVCKSLKSLTEDKTLWKTSNLGFFNGEIESKDQYVWLYKTFYQSKAAELISSLDKFPEINSSAVPRSYELYAKFMMDVLEEMKPIIPFSTYNLVHQCLNVFMQKFNGNVALALNLPGNPYKQTLMHYFAAIGDTRALQIFADNGGNMNSKDWMKTSPFSLLIEHFFRASIYKQSKLLEEYQLFFKTLFTSGFTITRDDLFNCFDKREEMLAVKQKNNVKLFYYVLALAYHFGSISEQDLSYFKNWYRSLDLGKFLEEEFEKLLKGFQTSEALTMRDKSPPRP